VTSHQENVLAILRPIDLGRSPAATAGFTMARADLLDDGECAP